MAATTHYLVVERGRFVQHGYTFRHTEIDRHADGALMLRLTAASVEGRFGRT